jgi:2',3'-cyclic-nucleotide 2'-phosphodiesterase (5'-nucleotidase family)
MAIRLPFNAKNAFRSRTGKVFTAPKVLGRKNIVRKPLRLPTVGNTQPYSNNLINRTGKNVTTYATKSAARRAAKQQSFQQSRNNFKAVGIGERLSNLRNKIAPPKPPQPKGLSKQAFNAPKVGESFGAYNKRTAFPKPLKAAGKRTFGQMIAKPRFGSMSK